MAASHHGSSSSSCACGCCKTTGRRFQSTSSSSGFSALAGLKGRNLLSIDDLSTEELKGLLQLAQHYKETYRDSTNGSSISNAPRPLVGDSVAMIFQKRSTRTRVSTETGMSLLGGHALFLGPSDVQLGVNESMRDTACVLSRFNSLLLARVYAHADVLELCQHATVPVINALSDLHHPLQTLADLLTLQQHYQQKTKSSSFDTLLQGKTLAWVGDGNNVLHDLMLGCTKMGMNVKIATPVGYECNADVLQTTHKLAKEHGATVTTTHVASEAVDQAHVVVTDTWVSMGQEEEYQKRVKEFEGYQVTMKLLKDHAAPNPIFLHCLPRHSEEVSDEVFYHPEISLVFPEAENRMWTVMAVMAAQLGKLQ